MAVGFAVSIAQLTRGIFIKLFLLTNINILNRRMQNSRKETKKISSSV